MVVREEYLRMIAEGFRRSPVVSILGPRQCGKTTLARQFVRDQPPESISWFDLESPKDLARQLPPWFENISKRQVKAPKIFLRDSGLLHALLGIHSEPELMVHPKLGASWGGLSLSRS